MTRRTIYLDYNATTPVDPEVAAEMATIQNGLLGNPSSLHHVGQAARNALEQAREILALGIGAKPEEIIFTSSATEANNLAISGVLVGCSDARTRGLAISTIEHHSVLETAEAVEQEGVLLHRIDVDAEGRLREESLQHALQAKPVLLSVIHANNEIGTIQDIPGIGQRCHESGILLHSDAVQAAGRIPLQVDDLQVDMLSLSAHKLYGPKGIGLLYLRRGVTLTPQIRGGSHERNLRAGTENVAAAVGFAKAWELAESRREASAAGEQELRDRLWMGIHANLPQAVFNGARAQSLSNTLNVSFPGIRNEVLLMKLDLAGLCVSTGSACASGAAQPSHVIRALGRSADDAAQAIRFSLGRGTTAADIDEAIAIIAAATSSLHVT